MYMCYNAKGQNPNNHGLAIGQLSWMVSSCDHFPSAILEADLEDVKVVLCNLRKQSTLENAAFQNTCSERRPGFAIRG